MTKSKVTEVKLDEKIKHGDKEYSAIKLRTPNAGGLRGLRLGDVANADVDSMIKLIPRISEPALTENDLVNMNPADFTKIAVEVANFLEPKT